MPANSRWDLIRRLRVKLEKCSTEFATFDNGDIYETRQAIYV